MELLNQIWGYLAIAVVALVILLSFGPKIIKIRVGARVYDPKNMAGAIPAQKADMERVNRESSKLVTVSEFERVIDNEPWLSDVLRFRMQLEDQYSASLAASRKQDTAAFRAERKKQIRTLEIINRALEHYCEENNKLIAKYEEESK